jgi:hypothetical protein
MAGAMPAIRPMASSTRVEITTDAVETCNLKRHPRFVLHFVPTSSR